MNLRKELFWRRVYRKAMRVGTKYVAHVMSYKPFEVDQ